MLDYWVMRRNPLRLFSTALIAFLFPISLMAENWPQWRGPLGNGVSPEEGLPVSFSPQRNLLWKAPIRGQGVSSPVVWENQIFVTSQLGRGTVRPGSHPSLSQGGFESSIRDEAAPGGKIYFLVHSIDRDSGELRWSYEFPAAGEFPQVHSKNNMAAPSCVTDGERVYCWFSTGQVVALTVQGEKSWERSLGEEYSPFRIGWGHASSPTLYQDRLFLLCDHTDSSYLLALDKASGKEIWKVDRGEGLSSYSTPMIVPSARPELLVNSSRGLDSYDPQTGERLWFLEQSNRFPIPSASFGDGVIFTSRGYRSGPYMAIEPGGSGNIADSNVKWQVDTGAPYVSSVVYYRGIVYMVNGSGIVTAVDGANGETLWRERVGGVFSASPVAGDGKIFLTSEEGRVTVLQAGREARILARSNLEEPILASPAISQGRIYFRTAGHVVSVGGR